MIDCGLMLWIDVVGLIYFVCDVGVVGDEVYMLMIDGKGVMIVVSGDVGFVYGVMMLVQLFSFDVVVGKLVDFFVFVICDVLCFKWCGVMVDFVCYFVLIVMIYGIVDQMVVQKLNVLYFYFIDDQGWCVEIKCYFDLMWIGVWWMLLLIGGVLGLQVGGFYIQVELKVLVVYVQECVIMIVFEVDLFGYVQVVVVFYLVEVGVFGDCFVVGYDWGVNLWLFSLEDCSMIFIKGVFDELMVVFLLQFIYFGGDEVVKDQWEWLFVVQVKMKVLGLKIEMQMQSWMIDQFGEYLVKYGCCLIGWDEIFEGGLLLLVLVMLWCGEKGVVEVVNQGYDVVLSFVLIFYFDSLQSDCSDELLGWLLNGDVIVMFVDFYKYDFELVGLVFDKVVYVFGVQINVFSEYLVIL